MYEYNVTNELSLEKEQSKRTMIYYAAPKPERYGYFSATVQGARDQWLADRGCDVRGNFK